MKKIVIGSIALIISLLFIFMSYKNDNDDIKETIKRMSTDKKYGIKFLGYGNYFIDKEISKYLTEEELK